MKRTPKYPERASEAEIKANLSRTYDRYILKPSKVNPIFTERPHYGIAEPVKGGKHETSEIAITH